MLRRVVQAAEELEEGISEIVDHKLVPFDKDIIINSVKEDW